ncbi:mechanosensitive ion channel [Roseofilum casamattae]|uniref:Mechanosensitive ion channel n=1 Tax=Roseofilum casamattae BLCC-M143 TaxID=3022442 RepID=A0ABT7BZL8_9CYAN|nr:mechanosensitive ion channel [Roseofilum casamattae]MDJ1183713.1 mechanosensitive ion channel [Roseofilum casamattae BLCC-M143]
MNLTWQNINTDVPILQDRPGIGTQDLLDNFLQADPAIPNLGIDTSGISASIPQWWDLVITIAIAAAILIVGFLVAWSVSLVAEGLLKRTELDNKLAAWIAGAGDRSSAPPVEKWVGAAVFWLIMLLVLVGVLDSLELDIVSQPLNTFLEQVFGFVPQIVSAAILLAVAWVLATVVRLAILRGLNVLNLDRRLESQVVADGSTAPVSLSSTLANAMYWFVFLLFLPSILSTLELEGTLEPVQALLNQLLLILPNLLAGLLIGAAGWLVATVVRRIVTNLLIASGADRIGDRFGLSSSGANGLSWIIGTLTYVLILIPFAIAALNAIRIEALSGPAIEMLESIMGYVPLVFTAAVIMVLAYVGGKFVSDLVTNILTGFGFDNLFYWLGLQKEPYATAPSPEAMESELPPPPPPSEFRTPSEIVGIVVLITILLFATVTATDILGLEALTLIMGAIIQIASQVLAGVVIFAIGLYFANLAFNVITSSGSRQAHMLAQAARIAIIILVGAMALRQMGIASDIVNLAFGLLFGAIAVAIAIAFGLGGRDIAAGQIQEWLTTFKDDPKD